MFDRRFVGLNSQFISVTPRFASSGTVLHVLRPYYETSDAAADTLFWIRGFVTVSIRIGGSIKNFVLKPTSQIEYLRNPIIILRNAIQSARNNQLLLPTWADLFSRNRPIIAVDEVRYYLLAAVFQNNNRTYNPPLGYLPGSPLVMVHLSKTAGEGIIRQVVENGVDPFDPNTVFELAPDSTGNMGQFAPNRYVVHKREVKGLNFEPVQKVILERRYSWDDDSILKEPSLEEQIQLLQYSDVPATAVVYALAETEYRELFTKAYLDAALAKLEASMGRPILPAGPTVGYGSTAPVASEATQFNYGSYTVMSTPVGTQTGTPATSPASAVPSPIHAVPSIPSGPAKPVGPMATEPKSVAPIHRESGPEANPKSVSTAAGSQPGALPDFIAQLLHDSPSGESDPLTPEQFNQFLSKLGSHQRKATE